MSRPYIIRNIPTYDIMGEESLLRIEQTADRILAEVGIEFRDDPVTLELWKQAGAKVDGVLVKFEPGMLREILKTAPQEFTQHARNPARSVRIGGDAPVSVQTMTSGYTHEIDKCVAEIHKLASAGAQIVRVAVPEKKDTDGQPIPGLYACGNEAQSIMGGTYPGAGITIGPALTFGYIAARHAASAAR